MTTPQLAPPQGRSRGRFLFRKLDRPNGQSGNRSAPALVPEGGNVLDRRPSMVEVKQRVTLYRPVTYQIKVPGELDETWSDWIGA